MAAKRHARASPELRRLSPTRVTDGSHANRWDTADTGRLTDAPDRPYLEFMLS